jgi:hypothetical protein
VIIPAALALGIGLVGAAAFAGSANTGGGAGSADRPEFAGKPNAAGLSGLRVFSTAAGLDKDWQDFLQIVAYGESRGHNDVGLGTAVGAPPWARMNRSKSEAKAAAIRYDAHEARYARCWARVVYVFGSGGFFAMLPASAMAVFADTELECMHPWAVFDPAPSLVMAMGYADRLMRWDGYADEPTFLNLRVGWGNPSKMGDAATLAEKRKKFSDHAQAIGLPPSLLDRRPSRLDFDPVALFFFLGGNVGWLPTAANASAGPVELVGVPPAANERPAIREAA